jgi:hypothetical protein
MKKLTFTLLFTLPLFLIGKTSKLSGQNTVIITEFMYNVPSADTLEFIELYNNGSTPVNMEGWKFFGVDFTFPAYTLDPGSYTIITGNAVGFNAAFGIAAFQWASGSGLNNTGETIKLLNAASVVVDSVAYKAGINSWPPAANGQGPSNVLCDYNADNNDPANWAAAVTPTGKLIGTTEILANPGSASACALGAVVGFLNNSISLPENAGTTLVKVKIEGGKANPTSVTASLSATSTASGTDYSATLPVTLTFPGGVASDTLEISVNIADDAEIEGAETLVLELSNPTNEATISPNGGLFTLTIIDNDAPQTNAMVITGVFDTQPAGTGVKGVELKALQNIPDLSIFGLEAANNGGGSTGVETPFPAIALNEGDCFYVADDSTKFFDFFGFYPNVLGGAANINGDDAIVLFENNIISDVFGETTIDGTGQPWEYTDGWAYRRNATGPDGNLFIPGNWKFSGINELDSIPNNASAPNPFPTCAYSSIPLTTADAKDDNASTPFNTAVTINILNNDELPIPLSSVGVTNGPSSGTATVNANTNITYTPNPGFCGTDVFTYQVCDAGGCAEATVTVVVSCPISYPSYSIGTVTTVNNTGNIDSLGVTCKLTGIVHGIDFQGGNFVQFVIIDQTGGITVFSTKSYGYTVNEGDEVVVQGKIAESNCLTQIAADTIIAISPGNPLVTPLVTTTLDEEAESELIELTNLTLVNPTQWLGNGNSFNVEVTNGTTTYTMRIDNDCELSSMPAPATTFTARGLGGQFDNNSPCDGGYQFLPRYADDITLLINTENEILGHEISLYPNPASDRVYIRTEIEFDVATVSNVLGQTQQTILRPGNTIDVSSLKAGIYVLTFRVADATWTGKFVKH